MTGAWERGDARAENPPAPQGRGRRLKVIVLLTRCLKPVASFASNKSSTLPAGGGTGPCCSRHPSMLAGQTFDSPYKLTCQAAHPPPAVVVPPRSVSWSVVHRQLVCQVPSQTSNAFETSRSQFDIVRPGPPALWDLEGILPSQTLHDEALLVEALVRA